MQLINLSIQRIIIHQIYQADNSGNKREPTQTHELTNFDNAAMEAFKLRVIDALGSNSKAVQMEIISQDTDDLPQVVSEMINQSNAEFIDASYKIAKKLSKAQNRRSIPGGIVVVFEGTQGHPLKKFLGIIKAEIHSAYEKEINNVTNEISLKFVEEVLLTPGSKLYKTAGFFQKASPTTSSENLNEDWTVMISDYQINQTDGKAAAKYFYYDFLGCGYPETSARTTKKFYESTSSFIDALDIPASVKNDYLNALTTYLKVDTSTTISSSDFASRYFDIDTKDSFNEYMETQGLPNISFTKDIQHIESKLKFRKINFSKNVKIIAPSEIFKTLVSIENINGDPDENGNPSEWTKVIIKDRIIQQE